MLTTNFPLAITGYSACNGLGATVGEVLSALRAGRRSLGPAPVAVEFDALCGVVPGTLPPIPGRYADYDSRQARLALHILDSVQDPVTRAVRRWGKERVGVVLATSTGGIAESEVAVSALRRTGRMPDGYVFARQHAFYAFAELVRSVSGVAGPAHVVSTACSSAGKAIASARRLILSDVVDAVLVGAVDTLTVTTLCGFQGLGVLSERPCRPFSAHRDGMNIGEGGAMLLLERFGEARAVLLGVGESSDARNMSAPDPDGAGARAAMREALSSAGLAPSEVDSIHAHGTGARLGDAVEATVVSEMFGNQIPVLSTKGYTGHMLGAAGATDAVFCVCAIEHGWAPASVGSDPIDPALDINVSVQQTRRRFRVIMTNSFGFGGSNVSVVFGAP